MPIYHLPDKIGFYSINNLTNRFNHYPVFDFNSYEYTKFRSAYQPVKIVFTFSLNVKETDTDITFQFLRRYPPHDQVSAEDMEYTIRCMNYFEKSAIAVYERICGGDLGGPLRGSTQAEIIRDFHEKVGITNLTKFAEGISKTKGYISPLLKGCKRKLPGK